MAGRVVRPAGARSHARGGVVTRRPHKASFTCRRRTIRSARRSNPILPARVRAGQAKGAGALGASDGRVEWANESFTRTMEYALPEIFVAMVGTSRSASARVARPSPFQSAPRRGHGGYAERLRSRASLRLAVAAGPD